MPPVMGIDPGLNGAIAVLVDGKRHMIMMDMPTYEMKKSNGKISREIDVHVLSGALRGLIKEHPTLECVIERAGTRPGEGTVSSWKNGCNWGMIYASAVAACIPVVVVSPQHWKKRLGVPADKDGARQIASRLLPMFAERWVLKKHDGRAEAALMALFLMEARYGGERGIQGSH